MNGEVFRVRVDRSLLKQAEKVAAEIGTTPQEIVRILFAQMVKLRRIPFPLNADAETVPDNLVDIERRYRIGSELDALGRITNVDPLPDKELARLYGNREDDEASIRRLVAAQPKGGE